MKKILTLGACAILGLTVLASCGEDNTNHVDDENSIENLVETTGVTFVNPGKLTIGASTDFVPMEFIDTTKTGQEQFVGADITFAKNLAKAFGVELVVKAMAFDMVLSSLDTNTIDVAISGFSYTPDRAASYLPTECYYKDGDGGQVAIVKAAEITKYQTLDDLNKAGIKVGAQTGSLQVTLANEQLPNATLITFTNIDDALVALESGTYDAVICAKQTAEVKIEQNTAIKICNEAFDAEEYEGNFAWVKKSNTALKNAIDKVIDEVDEKDLFVKWVDDAKALALGLGENAGELIPDEEDDTTTNETTTA